MTNQPVKISKESSNPTTDNFLKIFRAAVVIGILGWLAFFVYGNAT